MGINTVISCRLAAQGGLNPVFTQGGIYEFLCCLPFMMDYELPDELDPFLLNLILVTAFVKTAGSKLG